MKTCIRHILSVLLLPAAAIVSAHAAGDETAADTTIVVDKVQVTAIKQGRVLRSQPVASTIVGERAIERGHVGAIKDLSHSVPNLHAPDYGSRMTSSIYVRGLGARIDQPVMGLNVDNVPVMNKDNYDTELADAERIEVLRGPQSTLYGRNTMGGVINVYTLSPLAYQGVRLVAEYGSGDTYRLRASSYYLLKPGLGMAVTGYYTRTDGFFDNLATGEKCDWERLGGGRWKIQWRSPKGVGIDNTLSFSVLDQGGYPYAYIGEEIVLDGKTVLGKGQIGYNDPSSYRRTNLSDGLTIRYEAARFSVSSITSYQYSDDCMTLDQDFLPLSYFTLTQARTEHTLTEDLVFRSRGRGAYGWLFGAFGFYRHSRMNAPVLFKKTGIEELILKHINAISPEYVDVWDSDEFELGSRFRNPTAGGALYHESTYATGRWRFTAGLRFDYEYARLNYRNTADTGCKTYKVLADGTRELLDTKPIRIDNSRTLHRSFTELLPKFTLLYAFDEVRNLYLSVSKGYKAGGFNTQMFSDVLQQQIMKDFFHVGTKYDVSEVVSYDPEYSWNYELGSHFSCMDGAVRGDFALFYIDCRDQQLTVFPPGTTTGRMMTNAGRTRSLGGELSLQISPWRNLDLNAAYGYTDARFVRFATTDRSEAGEPVRVDYKGNRIPYAPAQTLSAGASWTIPTGTTWLGDVVLRAGIRSAGRIWWDERNTLSQPFYTLVDASVRIEHARYSIDLWGRNLAGRTYDVFHFKSIGNSFVQRGRPRTLGITLNINI
ncbi:TonB-dependent receptor [Alistipes sp.]|uniref:TonB-dependent receptor n=1 Tax=Alistipes sp. TaxID=1872444 RepID=UPI003AF06C6B